MAIQKVQATINGQTYNLTYNSTTSHYEATITAPSVTSYNLTGGAYKVEIKATNTAGTIGTGSGNLVVKERVKPTINIVSPTTGAYVGNNQQAIVFNLSDEVNGSGIDIASLSVKIDGTAATNITSTPSGNGYSCSCTPPVMSDGSHTVVINVSDHDGNAATLVSVTFTVDTVPPSLNIISPAQGLVTATAALVIQGSTNDLTSSPVTVAIWLNGATQGNATVEASGSFTKPVTLIEGSNTIRITATDKAGKTSEISRSVMLDTTVPVIGKIDLAPNPVDAGQTILISVVVS